MGKSRTAVSRFYCCLLPKIGIQIGNVEGENQEITQNLVLPRRAKTGNRGKTNQAALDQHGLDDEKGLGEKL